MEAFDVNTRFQHLRVGEFLLNWNKNVRLFDRLTIGEDRLKNPALFIDSMFYRIPTSSLWINGCQRQWSMIDGNKRMNAIKDFSEDKFPLLRDFEDQKCAGKYYSELIGKSYLIHRFHEYTLIANIFSPGMKMETINDLITRIKSD